MVLQQPSFFAILTARVSALVISQFLRWFSKDDRYAEAFMASPFGSVANWLDA
jgi:hypothetical protein